jgi:8-oxo-dGTP diphosphatase
MTARRFDAPAEPSPVHWNITTLVYVVNEGRLLLMHRRKEPNLGLWSPPGGKIEPGESPLAAALRELTEETGLQAIDGRLVAIVSELDDVRKEAWLMFAVRAIVGDDVLSGDGREGECRWVPLGEVNDLPVPPADSYLLEVVLRDEPGVSILTVNFSDGRLTKVALDP